MLSRRIIPCLDVRWPGGQGRRFRDHVDMGDIAELRSATVTRAPTSWCSMIGASPEARSVDVAWIAHRTPDRHSVLRGRWHRQRGNRAPRIVAGADKVPINSPALVLELITELADEFGVQCVVVGVDSVREPTGKWRVRRFSGDPDKTQAVAARSTGSSKRNGVEPRDRVELHGQRWRAPRLRCRTCSRRGHCARCR